MSPSPSASSLPSSSSVFFGRMIADLLLDAGRVLDFDQRQTMAVGRHQRQALRLEHELRAVEKEPRVLAGDRELRLGHHLAHGRARQRRARLAAHVRQRREVLARQRLHPRVEPVRRDLDAVLVLLDPDVGLRQRLDDLVELLRRQRQRSALRDRRRAAAAQRDFEIGRQHPHLVALRFDQHVGEDGNRVLALDDALEKLQFSQKVILPDDEFHRRVVTSSGGSVRAQQCRGEVVVHSTKE